MAPKVGYQPDRELFDAGGRKRSGLPARQGYDISGRERIAFEAVIGTDANQIALAPGTLRRSWLAKIAARYFINPEVAEL